MFGPGDIEAAVISALDAGLTPNVSTEVPNPRPDEFVRVTSIGGAVRNLVQLDARLLVECWGPDETTALTTARRAWALLFAASDSFLTPDVYATRIESTGPVNFPDPDTSSRYQFITTITTSLGDVA